MSYPFKANPISKSKTRKRTAQWALLGSLALLPAGAAFASDRTYGHAEVTVGGPNVQITVGKTWETGDRDCGRNENVVYEEKDDYEVEQRVIYSDDGECHHREHGNIIVYRDHPRCDREVRIIRSSEPVRCDRDVRIIRENIPERCDRGTRVVEVVRSRPRYERVTVIRRPEHRVVVVNGPDRRCDRRVVVTEHGYPRHERDDRDIVIERRDYERHDHGRDIIVNDGKGGGNGNGNGGDKIKQGHTDNGRHYGENYEHSGHSSRRDEYDRPSKRVTRERGRSGRML